MTMANVDYWRTFRDFTTNASVIADQPQDVVTFKGGDNIRLSFNEGDDIITWHADLQGITADVTANLTVTNDTPTNPSMLEYDPSSGAFTYHPPDLSDYATISYVDSAIAGGIGNIDLSSYATQDWVRSYVGSTVPDFNDYATIDYVNTEINTLGVDINSQIANIDRGYTGSQGTPGSSVKIVGSVENYLELLTRPKWTNYLGDVGDGVIMREGTANVTYGGETFDIEPGSLAVVIELGPPSIWDPTPGRIIGYTGSQGFTGSQGAQGDVGFTGSAIIVGQYLYEQNVASNVWTVNHNLGQQYLSVEIVDASSNSIVGTYDYPTVTFVDDNNLTITWKYQATGKAVLSAGSGTQGNVGYTGSAGVTGFTGSIGFSGSAGPPLRVVGAVPTFGDLPDPYTGEVNDVYVIEDTGRTAINRQLNPAVWDDLAKWTGYDGSQGNVGFTGSQGVGFTGSQGDIGYTGSESTVQGPIGFTGSQGPQGIIGFTGSQGIQGIQGNVGFTGSQGDQGVIGFTGSQGIQGNVGFNGSIGAQGNIGYTGSQGDQGIIGYTGSQGATGFTGSKGDTGFDGSTGFTGSQGDTGPSGTSVTIVGQVADFASLPSTYTGSLGDGYILDDTGNLAVVTDLGPPSVWEDVGQIVGYTGSRGFTGSIGFTGSQGNQGNVGFTGSQGDQGIIGFTGSRGDQGVIGFTGSQGDQGVTGFAGSQGDQGVIGFSGSQGDQGVIGFTGSKGDVGFTGSQGDQGTIGFTGSQGIQGNVGFNGSQGDQGLIGFTGSQGNVGFTGSASTAQGPTGFTGSQGEPGEAADTGFTGSQGNVGFTGSQGDQGITGFTGSKGDTGFTGSASTAQGPVGFTGSAGTNGTTGFTGSAGTTGFTGSQGFGGSTGFTGSSGALATLAQVTSNGNTTSNDISVGGLALSRDVNFANDTPTPGTALRLDRTVHALADGSYTLANGFDGQIMFVIPRNGATKGGISITFSTIRSSNSSGAAFSDFVNATLQPFNNSANITGSIVMYMYMDGAWNYELVSSQ